MLIIANSKGYLHNGEIGECWIKIAVSPKSGRVSYTKIKGDYFPEVYRLLNLLCEVLNPRKKVEGVTVRLDSAKKPVELKTRSGQRFKMYDTIGISWLKSSELPAILSCWKAVGFRPGEWEYWVQP